jgi:Rod binding domain-containing protein
VDIPNPMQGVTALPAQPASTQAAPRDDRALRETAEAFEAAFLSEMLQQTGLNAMPSNFGGGAGEEAFSSLLTEEYARLLAGRGGIGLAEQVFETLKQRTPRE